MPLPINFTELLDRPIRGRELLNVVGTVVLDSSTSSRVIIWDGTDQAGVDPIVGALQVISVEHHEIHEGEHFFCSDYDLDVDAGAGNAKYWLIRTGAVDAHLTFTSHSSLNGVLQLFEGATINADGNQITVRNSYRSNATVAVTEVYADPTVGADGTNLLNFVMGSDGASPAGSDGGIVERDNEIILDQSTDYVLKYTSESANNRVSMVLEFYEE